MALSILDGNQSATTLSTILSSGQHITAHTVVSLGTQAITDMRGAVSGSVVSISNLPATQPVSIASVTIGNTVTIAGTVTANPTGTQTIAGTVTANLAGSFNGAIETVGDVNNASQAVAVHLYDDGGTFMGNLNNPFYVSGTVTANVVGFNSAESFGTGVIQPIIDAEQDTIRSSLWIPVSSATNGTAGEGQILSQNYPMPISGTVTIGSALPTGTNRIGVVTIGGGTVTIGAGTAQIGSVTVGNSVTIGSLPALAAGTAQIGSVTASISNTVVTIYSAQGTTVTNSNFTSTTASTTLVSAVAGREVLTVFNEGAGNLFISPGATATTISYQVRLSAGDYWECPAGQLSLAHTAVFATAGTARVTEVS